MKKHRIILSTALLVLAFGTVASQSAQNAPTPTDKLGRHASMLGLVRTINTMEVTETSQYGSYEPWPILLAHHQENFNSWLKRFYSSNEPNVQFRDAPEILPECPGVLQRPLLAHEGIRTLHWSLSQLVRGRVKEDPFLANAY